MTHLAPLPRADRRRLERLLRRGRLSERRAAVAIGLSRPTLRNCRHGGSITPETFEKVLDWLAACDALEHLAGAPGHPTS